MEFSKYSFSGLFQGIGEVLIPFGNKIFCLILEEQLRDKIKK